MYRERVVRLLLAGALVMTAPGCASDDDADPSQPAGPAGGWRTAGCEFSRPPHFTTLGSRRLPATPPRLAAAMERIDRGGRERFADSFAGLEVDQARVRAIVYRVPSEAFDAFIRSSAEDSCIVVRNAAHGVAELTEWHDRVVADLPYWSAQGIQIATVGSRHDGAGVEIGTLDLEKTRRAFHSRYGDGAPLVLVEEGPVRPLKVDPPRLP
ncbi:hypothetical protein [Actinoplanes xinjiangensis]|jgi:hypothetical protein|uniref:Uncharacterized protein n=1 Tax=Actinoplanes xinjiangensis TaxID=512350 RepID=A0A316ER24_9ACTN|nr:hypothetical protein [Actinoplanes xinjiangensis]PWK32874.1 hypothetical protein BC793_129110 [Actinoplanes xinjiangensis]GIF43570.1 hypothetical protein Axi01nite_78810 [Actinoplanes xinjiangensis]